MSATCPFCSLDPRRILFSDDLALAFDDGFPASPGHALAIPRRHVGSWFELDEAERRSVLAMLDRLKQRVEAARQPDGYNIGINDGPAAGQTVPHVHVHLIPRYRGDVEDPKGGVRWVLPGKAAYWKKG